MTIPAYRIIAYHTAQTIRYKLASFLELQLPTLLISKPMIVAHPHSPTSYRRPYPPGRRPCSPGYAGPLVKYCTKAGIPPPPDKPSKPATQSAPPLTGGQWPTLPKASAAVHHRSPHTGPLTVSVSTAGRPVSQPCLLNVLQLPLLRQLLPPPPLKMSQWNQLLRACLMSTWLPKTPMPPLTLQSTPPPLHTFALPFIPRLVLTLTFLWPLMLLSNPSSTTSSLKSFALCRTSVTSSR